MDKRPSHFDAAVLISFLIFITFQPFLFHHEIIMMETGIHLPAINALFHGEIPYKDFFYLRGPLELYVPAWMMLILGKNMTILPIFYYTGTVLTMALVILTARQLFRTKLFFYLFVPVFIARTFPRVSFYYWGGMRYALGFLVILCAVLFFKSQKKRWLFAAGLASALGFLTTIETGTAAVLSVGGGVLFCCLFNILDRPFLKKATLMYALGIMSILGPYAIYLLATHSLIPFLTSIYVVISKMTSVFVGAQDSAPEGLEFLWGMLVPSSRYFKYMTPVYFYFIFFLYLRIRKRYNQLTPESGALITVAFYGLILYFAAFRKIEGHHFEMALQPEKILYFFMMEQLWLYLRGVQVQAVKSRQQSTLLEASRNWLNRIGRYRKELTGCFLAVIILTSLGYAFPRYSKRFVMFQLLLKGTHEDFSLLAGEKKAVLEFDRAQGMIVPQWQKEEIEAAVQFLSENTKPEDTLFAFPELGNFNFWVDRPFVGRFPIATFSWLYEDWYQELLHDLEQANPPYVVMTNLGHRTFPSLWYFRNKDNVQKFREMTNFVLRHYKPVRKYSSISIYQRKEE